MTPEVMKFWLDIFHSPVALTLAGALLGAVSTLAGVWLKSRHNAKENQKAWERQEITRKEERLFALKTGAYNDFARLFLTNPTTGFAEMRNSLLAVSIELLNYGSMPVKQETKKLFIIVNEWAKEQSEERKAVLDRNAAKQLDIVHEKIIGDIMAHHDSIWHLFN